jgi:hypothetical protein
MFVSGCCCVVVVVVFLFLLKRYLPSLWYHQVTQTPDAEGRCIAINMWFVFYSEKFEFSCLLFVGYLILIESRCLLLV